MPDPKDNAKASGDSHPPEPEGRARQPAGQPDAGGAAGAARGDAVERALQDESRAGKGENQAGFLKEKDGEAGRNT